MYIHKVTCYSLLAALLITSCSSLDLFNPAVDQLTCSAEWKEKNLSLASGEIRLDADLNKKEILGNAGQSLNLLILRHNRQAGTDAEKAGVDLCLQEYVFMKDYRMLNTLSLEMTIRDDSGIIMARYFHAEESRDSFFSSRFMYKELERGFKRLFR